MQCQKNGQNLDNMNPSLNKKMATKSDNKINNKKDRDLKLITDNF